MRENDNMVTLPLPLKSKIENAERDRKWLVIFKVRSLAREIYGTKRPTPSQVAHTHYMIDQSRRLLPNGWYLKTRIGGHGNVYYLVHPEKYEKENGHSFNYDVPSDVINM